jgi:hypothetical protein
MRYTKTNLAKKIESVMNSKAKKTKSKHVSRELKGMTELADSLGIKCDCFFTQWVEEYVTSPRKGRVACVCKIKK